MQKRSDFLYGLQKRVECYKIIKIAVERIKEMDSRSDGKFLNVLIQMGEALQSSGAEIYRVEDTLNRIGYAYGAEEMNVFVITSSIIITIKMPGKEPLTQTRRLKKNGGNDFVKLEELNELSRQICSHQISAEEFEKNLQKILSTKADEKWLLFGNILAAASFAVFFGGTIWDFLVAGMMGAVIWLLEKYMAPMCLNSVAYQISASFLSGVGICVISRIFPALHMDKIMIGDIMLLIPGLMFTNAIRDVLLGDTISASMRLVEALLLAAALALGFFAAIWLVGGIW